MTYLMEINTKFEKVQEKLSEIGELDSKPITFYETAKEAYEHRSNVDNLKQALKSKEKRSLLTNQNLSKLQYKKPLETVNELTSMNIKTSHKLLTNKDLYT